MLQCNVPQNVPNFADAIMEIKTTTENRLNTALEKMIEREIIRRKKTDNSLKYTIGLCYMALFLAGLNASVDKTNDKRYCLGEKQVLDMIEKYTLFCRQQ